MTVQIDNLAVTPDTPADTDFELDLTIVESGEVVHELLRMTDDGCGQTCQSACSTTCP